MTLHERFEEMSKDKTHCDLIILHAETLQELIDQDGMQAYKNLMKRIRRKHLQVPSLRIINTLSVPPRTFIFAKQS